MSDGLKLGTKRRAAKACSACRSDKVRCNGARPCNGCIKRGVASSCHDGCVNCRKLRLHCDGQRPCHSCFRAKSECLYDLDLITAAISPEAKTVHRNLSIDRAKLACANCRRDNKKCDDARPCSRCVARSEECVHIERGPKLVKLRCDACRQDNKRCEDGRPCHYCVQKSIDCITQPRKGRGHGTRVKAACLYCRRDKLRCDGNRPCSACVRRELGCIERPCADCMKSGIEVCSHRKEPPPSTVPPPPTFPPGHGETSSQFSHFLHGFHPAGQFMHAPPNGQHPGPAMLLAMPPPGMIIPPPLSPNDNHNTAPQQPMQLIYIPYQPGEVPPPGTYIADPNGGAMMVVLDPNQMPPGFPPYGQILVTPPPDSTAHIPMTIHPGDPNLHQAVVHPPLIDPPIANDNAIRHDQNMISSTSPLPGSSTL